MKNHNPRIWGIAILPCDHDDNRPGPCFVSTRFRGHDINEEEWLEDVCAALAEKCDKFANASPANPHTLSCTECKFFNGCAKIAALVDPGLP